MTLTLISDLWPCEHKKVPTLQLWIKFASNRTSSVQMRPISYFSLTTWPSADLFNLVRDFCFINIYKFPMLLWDSGLRLCSWSIQLLKELPTGSKVSTSIKLTVSYLVPCLCSFLCPVSLLFSSFHPCHQLKWHTNMIKPTFIFYLFKTWVIHSKFNIVLPWSPATARCTNCKDTVEPRGKGGACGVITLKRLCPMVKTRFSRSLSHSTRPPFQHFQFQKTQF